MATRTEKEPSPRTQALDAIEGVIERLAAATPIGPLDRKLMCVSLDHAKEQIGKIQELKRSRRTPKPEVAPAG